MKLAPLPLFLVALLSPALTALSDSPNDWWTDGGYGRARVHSTSLIDDNGRSTVNRAERVATNRGIAVRLGADEGIFIFDTELLRATGASTSWTGGLFRLAGQSFLDRFPSTPCPPYDALFYFGTHANTPGWSKGDSFTDPRPAPGLGALNIVTKQREPDFGDVPFGPLPREWAKYRGMYLHEDRVVFAYTVGVAAVLESPDLEKVREQSLITRTFNVLTPGDFSSLLVADAPAGVTPTVEHGMVEFIESAVQPTVRTVVGVRGMPAGGALVVNGTRVALKLPPLAAGQKFKVVYARGPVMELAHLREAVESTAEPGDLQRFTHGGAAQWPHTVTVKGTPGTDNAASPYLMDVLPSPLGNSEQSASGISGLDFFKDGSLAFCTRGGDVWVGKGIDDRLEKIEWKRFAAGLDCASGLRIVDDQIYVLGRDQITRLHDLNNDGEADFYECFNNDVKVTPSLDDSIRGLELDSKGNFYFSIGDPVTPGRFVVGAPSGDHHNYVCRVSGSGQKFDAYATGMRASDGIAIAVGPNDELYVSGRWDSQAPHHYVGFQKTGPNFEKPAPDPVGDAPHICWLPRNWSAGNNGLISVTSDRWGVPQGTVLFYDRSYDQAAILRVVQENAGVVQQGDLLRLPLETVGNILCARFNPIDGQLYVGRWTGMNRDKVNGILRVRYTGKPVTPPKRPADQ